MQESLITFETTKLAKEKGFDIEVWDYFKLITISVKPIEDCVPDKQNFNNISDTIFSRPSQSLLQKWLREIHDIDIVVMPYGQMVYRCFVYKYKCLELSFGLETNFEKLFEEGLEEGLKLISEIK